VGPRRQLRRWQWRQPGLARLVAQQAGNPLAHEPLLPAPYARLRDPGPAHDLRRATTFCRCQDNPHRQTCFCRLLRSAITAANHSRSAPLTSMLIPSRIAQHRMRHPSMESYDCVVPLRGELPLRCRPDTFGLAMTQRRAQRRIFVREARAGGSNPLTPTISTASHEAVAQRQLSRITAS
jgi:hypothetical protein